MADETTPSQAKLDATTDTPTVAAPAPAAPPKATAPVVAPVVDAAPKADPIIPWDATRASVRPQTSLGWPFRLQAYRDNPTQETHDDAALVLHLRGDLMLDGVSYSLVGGLIVATPIAPGEAVTAQDIIAALKTATSDERSRIRILLATGVDPGDLDRTVAAMRQVALGEIPPAKPKPRTAKR